MIKNNEVLNLLEVEEYVKKDGENQELIKFIKGFSKIKPKEAKELKKKLEGLELMKVKPEHIAKIIDMIPEDQEELNKIFVSVSLNEDETKKILDTVKEFK